MALRYVGDKTKITLRYFPERGSAPWMEGMYTASFNVGGVKMDGVVLHIAKERGSVHPTFCDLGLSRSEATTTQGYDVIAEEMCRRLIAGSKEVPHWRYGRAKEAAKALWRDLESSDLSVRRSKR